jgi:tetratricopeptide (TPR) repeat protein
MQSWAPERFADLFETARSLHDAGNCGAAADTYARAIAVDGTRAEAHNNLGAALLTLGAWDTGAAALERALALRPDYPEALESMGHVHRRGGDHAQACRLYARCVVLDPGNVGAWIHLGETLLVLGRFEQARAAFEDAVARAPRDAVAHNALGVALDRCGLIDDAQAAFRTALYCDPGFERAACNLGKVLLTAGDVADAAEWFEHALALEPGNAHALWNLTNCRRGNISAAHRAELERLAAEAVCLPMSQQIEVHFALAQAYESTARYADALAHLRVGNTLKRATVHYDEAARLRFLESLPDTFNDSFIAALHGCGDPSARPIFIIGMPRSGTTLVEQVLAAQPGVSAAGEVHFFERAVNETLMSPGMTSAGVRSAIGALAQRYLASIAGFAGTHVTDKLLENFCFAPLISLAFPNARILHVRRDRADTTLSCYATLFADGAVPYAYDRDEIDRYYTVYEHVMACWRARLPADRLLDIDYEDLVANFDAVADRIVAFCGMERAPTALVHEVRRPVRTASAVEVRQPLYQTSVGRSHRFAGANSPEA